LVNFSLKRIINKILVILKVKKIGFYQNFNNYFEALKHCNGYNNKNLIKYIFLQTIKSKSLNQIEKDGILYKKININPNFFKYINKTKRKIKILDIGGSYGALYKILKRKNYTNLEYSILEQEYKIFLAHQYRFQFENIIFLTLNQFKNNKKKYDIIIFETSLQYFKNPYLILNLCKYRTSKILIINLTLTKNFSEYLKIENPDPKVYSFNYPCWFLNENRISKELIGYKKKVFKVNNIYKLSKNEYYSNLFFSKISQ
jgi:putative methyltransferase (TIGR04325 family)